MDTLIWLTAWLQLQKCIDFCSEVYLRNEHGEHGRKETLDEKNIN
jgi:hypothetical protein